MKYQVVAQIYKILKKPRKALCKRATTQQLLQASKPHCNSSEALNFKKTINSTSTYIKTLYRLKKKAIATYIN